MQLSIIGESGLTYYDITSPLFRKQIGTRNSAPPLVMPCMIRGRWSKKMTEGWGTRFCILLNL